MCAALVGNHSIQPRVHLFHTDDLSLAPAGQQLAQRRSFQLLGDHSLTQQVDTLLQHRAQAGEAPGVDQRPGEGVLLGCSSVSETETLTVTRPS